MMKYFREYPWGLQALLFVLMVFTFMSAATAVMLSLVYKTTGFTLEQIQGMNEQSSQALVNAAVLVQGFASIFSFLLPAVVFAYLSHPQPKKYLGLRRPGKNIQWVLAILVVLGAMPVLDLIMNLVSKIDFGSSIKAGQEANDRMMKAFMKMPTFSAFIKGFLVMAIIPAFGEELFFRGVLMRLARKRTRSMVIPIVFTAIIFSLSHTNIYGYLSIFLAGVLLASIYYLTGSIWCSIVAHLVFNGLQVVLSYMSNTNAAIKSFTESDTISYTYAGIGAVVFAISFYMLLKNKTPLPKNWAEDFEAPSDSPQGGEV